MKIRIIQTSDSRRYSRMLQQTSRTAIEFCRRHGHEYASFVGIKRGIHPAHATYNRIPMLVELIAQGFDGWVLYLDADAYVYDLNFDLSAYLAGRNDRAAIIATIAGEPVPWHVNAGVFLINLGHPIGRALVDEWSRRFLDISDEELAASESVWDSNNDQTLLYLSLHENAHLREAVLFEDYRLINDINGTFIRQYLAAFDGNLGARTDAIAQAVEDVLARFAPAAD